mgnify:FL=1
MPVLEFAAVIEIMAFAERLAGGMIDEYELVAQTMGDNGERRVDPTCPVPAMTTLFLFMVTMSDAPQTISDKRCPMK